jgi:hypothetical protein
VQLQILEVILWPKNSGLEPRRVTFAPGVVNVISGASKRGKSSVIPIIDYCLGSRLCGIPAGKIRESCEWFGILIRTSEGEKLLARREPGNQQSTDEMMILDDLAGGVPLNTPAKNTTRQAVKRLLDRLAGLSNLGFDAESTSNNFQARPSFRDTLAFCFQPQNIVANPDVLYFRADTIEHREKVRTIFPYVLGATTGKRLALKWELENLQKELRRKLREQAAYANVSETWLANLQVWVTEARELGLLTENITDATEATLIAALERVLSAGETGDGFSVTGSQASASEYAALQNEESTITRELAVARHRLNQITAVRDTVSDFKDSLSDQANRLGISRWLRNLPDDGTRCPVCDGNMASSHNELDQLCDALSVIEDETHAVSKAPPVLDRDLVDVTERLQLLEDQLKAVRIRRRAIEERSKTIRENELATARIARFLGRVEEALKLFTARANPNGLDDDIDKLNVRISEIYDLLSEAEYARKLEAAVTRVSRNLTKVAVQLDVERKDAPARLNIKELTVGVTDYAGREDFLWQLGSGANWLSYHVAAILALQAFFLNQTQSPVPALVIFDQPSQVYFPRRLARREAEMDELLDEDVQSIRGFFDAMGKLAVHFKGKLQIIVLDHAGSDVWGNLEGVELAEEWRGEDYLVPPTWFDLPD